jgi:hypothetical protein
VVNLSARLGAEFLALQGASEVLTRTRTLIYEGIAK